MAAVPRGHTSAALERARRFRSPLLLALWALLALEGLGGLVIFFARVAFGSLPGEALHVLAGVALTLAWTIYQWRHWTRVRPFRSQLHFALGLIAALAMGLTNVSGLALGWTWWRHHLDGSGPPPYPPPLSAIHDIGSMMTLTFILSHLGAVLARDRRARELGAPPTED
jgi:hypothetical protein